MLGDQLSSIFNMQRLAHSPADVLDLAKVSPSL